MVVFNESALIKSAISTLRCNHLLLKIYLIHFNEPFSIAITNGVLPLAFLSISR